MSARNPLAMDGNYYDIARFIILYCDGSYYIGITGYLPVSELDLPISEYTIYIITYNRYNTMANLHIRSRYSRYASISLSFPLFWDTFESCCHPVSTMDNVFLTPSPKSKALIKEIEGESQMGLKWESDIYIRISVS